jgi:hypothetical protein
VSGPELGARAAIPRAGSHRKRRQGARSSALIITGFVAAATAPARSRFESQVALWAIALHRTWGSIRPRLIWLFPTARCGARLRRQPSAVVGRGFRALLKPSKCRCGLANVVEAYRGGDYTIRGNRHAGPVRWAS